MVFGFEVRGSDHVYSGKDHLHCSYDSGSLCTIHQSPYPALWFDWVYVVCWSNGDHYWRGLFLPGWPEGVLALHLESVCSSTANMQKLTGEIDLNGNLFPLHYSQPYPITRGIRVEIAAIILISLLGIMSQMKIWKIIKKRREDREAEQKRKEHQRNISDEEQGRKIEEGAALDRVMWEDRYGHKDKTHVQERYLDSGVGTDEPSSTRKGSFSDAEGIEMHNLKGPSESSRNEKSAVHVTQDDDSNQLNSANGERTRGSVPNASGGPSRLGSPGEAYDATGSGPSSRAIPELDPNLTLLPNVVHLSFKIPDVDAQNDDSRSSVAASLASEYLPDRLSKRLSGGSSLMRKLAKRPQRSYAAGGTDEEALVIPHASHDDDDQDSSVAATIDGVSNDAELEEALRSTRRASAAFDKRASQGSLDMLRAQIHESLDPAFIPDFSPQPSIVDAVSTKLPASKTPSIASSRRSSTGSFGGEDKPQIINAAGEPSAKPLSNSETSEQHAVRAGLTGNLPEGASKVVMAYRTNEWAKHLDGADLPEIDPLNVNKRQSQELLQQREKAAPVNVQALQQTPLDAEPAPAMSHADLPSAKRRSSTFMARNPFSKPKESQQPKPIPHPLTISKDMQRMPSQTSIANAMSRSSSQTSLDSNKESYRPPLPKFRTSQTSLSGSRGFRSSSTPIATSPLVESPIEEGIESSFPARFTPQSNHLMSQRDRIITSKPSSTSLLRTSYSNVALDQHPAYRTIEEDDDIPLAQRKSILQKQRSSSGPSGAATPLQRSGSTTPLRHSGSSTPGINGAATLQRVPSGTDTPQRLSTGPNPSLYPVRPVPVPRDTTTSQWRASLQPNTTAHLQHQEMEARRADMLREKRRASTTKQEQQFAQGIRASVLDKGMRRGSMLDLHKAAMRKMQQDVKL